MKTSGASEIGNRDGRKGGARPDRRIPYGREGDNSKSSGRRRFSQASKSLPPSPRCPWDQTRRLARRDAAHCCSSKK